MNFHTFPWVSTCTTTTIWAGYIHAYTHVFTHINAHIPKFSLLSSKPAMCIVTNNTYMHTYTHTHIQEFSLLPMSEFEAGNVHCDDQVTCLKDKLYDRFLKKEQQDHGCADVSNVYILCVFTCIHTVSSTCVGMNIHTYHTQAVWPLPDQGSAGPWLCWRESDLCVCMCVYMYKHTIAIRLPDAMPDAMQLLAPARDFWVIHT